jgi:hypothetical protein
MAADKLLTLCACMNVLPCQAQDVLAEPKPRKHAGDFPLFVLKYLQTARYEQHGATGKQHYTLLHCFVYSMVYAPLSEDASVVCDALISASLALLALVGKLAWPNENTSSSLTDHLQASVYTQCAIYRPGGKLKKTERPCKR